MIAIAATATGTVDKVIGRRNCINRHSIMYPRKEDGFTLTVVYFIYYIHTVLAQFTTIPKIFKTPFQYCITLPNVVATVIVFWK